MGPSSKPPSELLGCSQEELASLLQGYGQPLYRGRQLFEALYSQRVAELQAVSTLPQDLREELARAGATVGLPKVEKRFNSQDGTIRYLLALTDGQTVEAVWMPEGDGSEAGDEETGERGWHRATICISSQMGCAVDCKFCLTAQLGVKRNLTAGEIIGQVGAVLNDRGVTPPKERVNVVFMGMGEPFLNYDNFVKAARLLAEGVGIPESRMTVSTAGVVPRIYDFGKESLRPKLAISLNASNDDVRSQIMPINRKWNIEALMKVAREFPLRPRERLTFEYVVLKDVNDRDEHARELVQLLHGIRAKVNLIAWNPGPGIPFGTPSAERVLAFQSILVNAGFPCFIRRPRGREIFAACGQLKRTLEILS